MISESNPKPTKRAEEFHPSHSLEDRRTAIKTLRTALKTPRTVIKTLRTALRTLARLSRHSHSLADTSHGVKDIRTEVKPFRITVEMTWGETASVNVKDNGQRDNKAAVSPSRPMTCSVRRYF